MKSLSEFINESLILEGDMSKHIPMLLDVFSGKISTKLVPIAGGGFKIQGGSNKYDNRRRLMKLLTSYKQINNPESFNFKEGNIYLFVGGFIINGEEFSSGRETISPADTGIIALGKEGETIYTVADAWAKDSGFLKITNGKSTMDTLDVSWKDVVDKWEKATEKFRKEHPEGIRVEAEKIGDTGLSHLGYTKTFGYNVYELPEKYSEFLDALANLK